LIFCNMNTLMTKSSLESFFESFRNNIIGIDQYFDSPFGRKTIVYADWTASGRLYRPIEEKILNDFGPFVANTHTETTVTGTVMTLAYHKAREIIKKHVNASEDDVFIAAGTGMTGGINKFQRILGLKVPENLQKYTDIPQGRKSARCISHMEHRCNHTSGLEAIAKVVWMPHCERGRIRLGSFAKVLAGCKDYPLNIVSVTAWSNVAGMQTPCHRVAKTIHES